MKLEVVKKSCVIDGKEINYKALIGKGSIEGVSFELNFKPREESKIVKNMLIEYVQELDVQVASNIKNNIVYEHAYVEIAGVGEIPLKCTPAELFIIKLYNKVA